MYQRCIPCLRKSLYVFSDTCCHHISLRCTFNFTLIRCTVQFRNWFKYFPLYSCYSSTHISLFSYPLPLFFSCPSVVLFSLACDLSREIIRAVCKSLALFLISLNIFFAPIILFSISSAVVKNTLVRVVRLINRLIYVILIRLPVTFIFLYFRSCSQSRLTS